MTRSDDYPLTAEAYDRDYNGGGDAALSILELAPGPSVYCVSSPNSSGAGATIGSTGSLSITANDFTLTVAGATPGEFGLFFYGPEQRELSFGDGYLCIGAGTAGLFRLNPPIRADGTGAVARLLDFTQPPASSGPGAIISDTMTWNFQFWYRDPLGPGGSGFNLSNGLSVSFCP